MGISVTRDKKKFVSAGRGIALTVRSRKTTIAEDDVRYYYQIDLSRKEANEYYIGRAMPLLDEEDEPWR